jgi:hypothetical protein
VLVQKKVFKLNVTVGDASIVTIADSFDDLFKHTFGLLLLETSIHMTFQIAMQTSTADVLHDQDHVLACINYFVERYNMLVFHFLHQLDLSLHALPSVWVKQLVFFVNFHGYLPVRRLVQANPNDCVRTLANLFADHIVVQILAITEYHAVIMCLVRVFFFNFPINKGKFRVTRCLHCRTDDFRLQRVQHLRCKDILRGRWFELLKLWLTFGGTLRGLIRPERGSGGCAVLLLRKRYNLMFDLWVLKTQFKLHLSVFDLLCIAALFTACIELSTQLLD